MLSTQNAGSFTHSQSFFSKKKEKNAHTKLALNKICFGIKKLEFYVIVH